MTPDTENRPANKSEFLASNAEFFAHAFAPLNKIFQNPGPMIIVSEEKSHTIVVGLREANDNGDLDIDCALLKPNQQSLSDCIKTITIEDGTDI
jgi:hypothetical protein